MWPKIALTMDETRDLHGRACEWMCEEKKMVSGMFNMMSRCLSSIFHYHRLCCLRFSCPTLAHVPQDNTIFDASNCIRNLCEGGDGQKKIKIMMLLAAIIFGVHCVSWPTGIDWWQIKVYANLAMWSPHCGRSLVYTPIHHMSDAYFNRTSKVHTVTLPMLSTY